MSKRNSRNSTSYFGFTGGFVQNAHYILLFTMALFTLAALGLGEVLNLYDRLWWWDDMLHGFSGIILGLVGLLVIYLFNARYSMAISPLFVAVFVFCFALMLGVLWEIYEFGMDYLLGSTMQQWNVSPNETMIGHDYQGVGLRDTMSDLIMATCGATLAAGLSYALYKYEKSTLLGIMRRAFPWHKRRHA